MKRRSGSTHPAAAKVSVKFRLFLSGALSDVHALYPPKHNFLLPAFPSSWHLTSLETQLRRPLAALRRARHRISPANLARGEVNLPPHARQDLRCCNLLTLYVTGMQKEGQMVGQSVACACYSRTTFGSALSPNKNSDRLLPRCTLCERNSQTCVYPSTRLKPGPKQGTASVSWTEFLLCPG